MKTPENPGTCCLIRKCYRGTPPGGARDSSILSTENKLLPHRDVTNLWRCSIARRSASRRNTNCSKFFANVISRHPSSRKQQSWMNSLPSLAVIASMLFDCSPELILWFTSHPPCPGGSFRGGPRGAHRTLGSCRSHLREASESHSAWSHLGAGAERASGCRSDRPATPLSGQPGNYRPTPRADPRDSRSTPEAQPATKSSRQIPIRTFADWKEPEPGFLEVDFVAHCGDCMQGTFLWSLVATDVCSG